MKKLMKTLIVLCLLMMCNILMSANQSGSDTPQIYGEQSLVRVPAGQTAVLECRVICSVPVKATAFYEGATINFQADHRYGHTFYANGTYRIYILNAKVTDSGMYSVLFQNDNGMAIGNIPLEVYKVEE